MSDEVFVEVEFEDGQLQFTEELMQAMWEPTRLIPHPVELSYAFEIEGEHIGITDLLCYMDELKPELRDQGPDKIIETLLELINQVYIGDGETTLIGRCVDLYGIELEGRVGLVFRTVVFNANKEVEEMLAIRQVAQQLFPVPNPESADDSTQA